MKRQLKASTSTTEKLHRFMDLMMDEGVDEHEMLKYIVDTLPSQTVYNMMKDLAWNCGLDVNELINEIKE